MRSTHRLKLIEEEKGKAQRELQRLDEESRQLMAAVERGLEGVGRHDRVKVQAWLRKLDMKIDNPVWKSNRNFYLRVLAEMAATRTVLEPFNKSPPEGPLPRLTPYDVPYPLRSRFLHESEREREPRPTGCSLEGSFVSTRRVSANELNKENFCNENRLTGRTNSKSIRKADRSRSARDQDKQQDRTDRERQTDRRAFPNNNHTNRRITFNEGIVGLCSKVSSNSDEGCLEDSSALRRGLECSLSRERGREQVEAGRSESQELVEAKTFMLLKRSLKFLLRHCEALEGEHEYASLVADIVRLGDERGSDLRGLSVELSPSPSKIVFKKYSERIKEHFERSGEESKEFMEYLSVLRHR